MEEGTIVGIDDGLLEGTTDGSVDGSTDSYVIQMNLCHNLLILYDCFKREKNNNEMELEVKVSIIQ